MFMKKQALIRAQPSPPVPNGSASLTRVLQLLGQLVVILACLLVSSHSWGNQCTGWNCPPDNVPPTPQVDVVCPVFDSAKLPPSSEISEPTTVAGTIKGSFSVSSSGEAVYTMPLVVPPGRAGMEPALALTYNSSRGDGPFGMGFSLVGISVITRCASNYAQDGWVGPVLYDTHDNLCLDGLRLVPIGVTNDSKEGRTDEFRTFPDTFQRVLARYPLGWPSKKGPAFLVAYTKAGRIVEYGTEATGQVLGRDGLIRSWMITKESDRHSNSILYKFRNDHDMTDGHTITYAPLRIDYTSHPSAPASRAVTFEYADWNYHTNGFEGGMPVKASPYIGRIYLLGPGDKVVRAYSMTYGSDGNGGQVFTGRRRLERIYECAEGDFNKCKPPTYFDWLNQPALGLTQIQTSIKYPGNDHDLNYQWLMADLTGDGLEDLVVSRTDPNDANSSQWLVARNKSSSATAAFEPPTVWATTERPQMTASAQYGVQLDPPNPPSGLPQYYGRWRVTPSDHDHDGRADLLISDPSGGTIRALMSKSDGALIDTKTDIELDWGSNDAYTRSAAIYLDVNGDGALDVVECQEELRNSADIHPASWTPGSWSVQFWHSDSPANGGHFSAPQSIDLFEGRGCYLKNYITAADLNGDGKYEMIVPEYGYPQEEDPSVSGAPNYYCQGTCNYQVISFSDEATFWSSSGEQWTLAETNLPVNPYDSWSIPPLLVFMDINGDGLPDALMNGYADGRLRTSLNNGDKQIGTSFEKAKIALPGPVPANWSLAAEGTWMGAASPFDYNGDGQMDLLIPMSGQCSDPAQTRPCLVVMVSSLVGDGTFTVETTDIPANDVPPYYAGSFRRSWLNPQSVDVNGDGRADVVMPLDGKYTILLNSGPQNLLIGVTDGMNPLDHGDGVTPNDPGFHSNVSITYGSLIDRATTNDVPQKSSLREIEPYLPRSDLGNGCDYPRACVVGAKRVVNGYTINDGMNQPRIFWVGYRDGRYHQLGRGWLGFGSRIITDLDTSASVEDFYDNLTYNDTFYTYPYVGQSVRQWKWNPVWPAANDPSPVALSYTEEELITVGTNGDATYFTLSQSAHTLKEEGMYPFAGGPATMRQYVAATALTPAVVLSESYNHVLDHDLYGNIRKSWRYVTDLDDQYTVERAITNDEPHWLLGQVTEETECGEALTKQQYRMTKRQFDSYGDVKTESHGSPFDPETKLTYTYTRDVYGNITGLAAEDAFYNHRTTCVSYDGEGIFPYALGNAVGHISYVGFDQGLGVKVAEIDPNGLVSQWRYDGFGRIAREIRPDGNETKITIQRTKDGGPDGNWYRVRTTSNAKGVGQMTTETDPLGRSVRSWIRGAGVKASSNWTSTMQPIYVRDVQFDHFGRVARTSLPYLDGDPSGTHLYNEYAYDALGRLSEHTTPWGAVAKYAYKGASTHVAMAGTKTSTDYDSQGRPSAVTDSETGVTSYGYGPFGKLWTVVTPDGLVSNTEWDAYGRIRWQNDPDRGVITAHYNGFDDRTAMTDALGRSFTFGSDGLGRLVYESVTEQSGTSATGWQYDSATHGIGQLMSVTTSNGDHKRYSYNSYGRPHATEFKIGAEVFSSSVEYDAYGHPWKMTYPNTSGGQPFVVVNEYDIDSGDLRSVHHGKTDYWTLTGLDGAGRHREETFGNAVTTTRAYFAEKGRLKSIVSKSASQGILQDLHYTYDDRLNLSSRVDALQTGATPQLSLGEHFKYDTLDRLTCSWFDSLCASAADCTCSQSVSYYPNGNIDIKSDVGKYDYDPAHRRAVLTAGPNQYKYDAVGNQKARPDAEISYTAFNLPKSYVLANETIDFTYDGDQHRTRKTTPSEETIYVGGLYERKTHTDSQPAEHKYYVMSDERVVAVVTRGGGQEHSEEAVYIHVDNLGSTDAVTDALGDEVKAERASFDAFGARRNPKWGSPLGAVLSKLSLGYTAQEMEGEPDLVNMNGRIYDPNLGRFLSADPKVSDVLSGQSWNPYSYVLNNPFKYTDPSGFEGEDKGDVVLPPNSPPQGSESKPNPQSKVDVGGFRYDFSAVSNAGMKGGISVSVGEDGQARFSAQSESIVVTGRQIDMFGDELSPTSLRFNFTAGDLWFMGVTRMWATGNAVGSAAVVAGTVAALPSAAKALGTIVIGLALGAKSEADVPKVVAIALATESLFGGLGKLTKPESAAASEAADAAAASAAKSPSCPGCICFAPGTMVLMADGSAKTIEAIEVGDLVLSDNPEDNQPPKAQPVLELFKTATYRLFHVETNGDQGGEVLATGRHPFWTRRGWVPAEQLEAGDVLLSASGEAPAVRSISLESRDTPTYNLSVEVTHAYFVLAGDTSVLVHNVDPWDIRFTQGNYGSHFTDAPEVGRWAGRPVSEAVAEARLLGRLPDGLTLNAVSMNGGEYWATLNNRTLGVARQANLANVNPVDAGAKGINKMTKLLKDSGLAGPVEDAIMRCR